MVVGRSVLWIVVLGLVVASSGAAQVETREDFTARVTAALAEQDPEAAGLFAEANAARERQRSSRTARRSSCG